MSLIHKLYCSLSFSLTMILAASAAQAASPGVVNPWGTSLPGSLPGNLPGSLPNGGCIPYLNCDGKGSNSSVQALPGKWEQSSYKNTFGTRQYSLYVPKKYTGQAIPLMVMLHGCTQSAQEFANETGMNATAEKYGFAVLYPEQGYQDNIWRCWNWFKPENQTRSGGELGIVLGMMNEISKKVSIDVRHIYVAGISAGAAMAANMLACHSDLFAGAGIASGLEFQAATSEVEAHQVMSSGSGHDIRQSAAAAVKCSGANAKMPAVIAIYGTQDSTVNPVNTSRVIQQFSMMNDILDDKQVNQSQNDRVITTRQDQVPNGYKYRTDYYGGNGTVHLAKVSVEGMAHAWSGAVASGQFADPRGPNAAEMIWLFLWNYGGH
jgi:poly(hydroxyalkanoate) depolymerase family esterase